MAKRIKRRAQDETVLHKWWFNAGVAFIFLALASTLLIFAQDSHSLVEYIFAILFVVWGMDRVIRGLRYASDR